VDAPMTALAIGEAEVRRRGRRVALLAFGSMVEPAREAAEALDASLVNMRFVRPLDEKTILEMADGHQLLVTLEENTVRGGAGSGVSEVLAAHGMTTPVLHLGLPDTFLEHGGRGELLAECGLHPDGIIRAVRDRLDDPGLATGAPVA